MKLSMMEWLTISLYILKVQAVIGVSWWVVFLPLVLSVLGRFTANVMELVIKAIEEEHTS